MTDLGERPTPTSTLVDDAVGAADDAARAAGLRVRELTTHQEFDAVCAMFVDVWHPDPSDLPVTSDLLRAMTLAGAYVSGAYDGDELVAACVGFFGAPSTNSLHSHIAGVSAAGRGRSVGFAMKLHQRAWSMLRGLSIVAWTFDPLVRRNAYFNLVKLAASGEEYLTNFYGDMHDEINANDESDRLLVSWHLAAPAVVAACAGSASPADAAAEHANGASIALTVGPDGGPVSESSDTQTVLVAVPGDIEAMRIRDPACAKAWRVAVRETLGVLLDEGAQVTGFDRSGWYVVRRGDGR